jgi:hypothetical protein
MDVICSKRTHSRDFIFSFKDKISPPPNLIENFDKLRQILIEKEEAFPRFPGKRNGGYKQYKPRQKSRSKPKERLVKGANAWKPTDPTTDNAKIQKLIKGILNKITARNAKKLIPKLIIEIKKFNNYDILDILSEEILEKIVFDKSFQEIYIDIYRNIRVQKEWHITLITIIEDKKKFYWQKNISGDDIKLNGPFDNKALLINDINKHVSIRLNLLNALHREFKKRDEYMTQSKVDNLDDDKRFKLRRNVFGTVEFIAKLFNKDLMSENIVISCLQDLLKNYNEDDLETFSIMWNTIDKKKIRQYNDIKTLFYIIETKVKKDKWKARTRFMLDDLMDSYKSLARSKVRYR